MVSLYSSLRYIWGEKPQYLFLTLHFCSIIVSTLITEGQQDKYAARKTNLQTPSLLSHSLKFSSSLELILPSTFLLWDLICRCWIQLLSPQHKKEVELLKWVHRRSRRWSESWSTTAMETGWECRGCSAGEEKASERCYTLFQWLKRLQESWRGTLKKGM